MKNLIAFFVLISASLFAGPFLGETLLIENVKVKARTVIHSCSYFSNAETDLAVVFKSGPVDYGTRVFLEFGWGGKDGSTGKDFEWANRSELELTPGSFTTWTGDLTQVIAERSSPHRILDLNFVFRVEEPGKAPRLVGGPQKGDTFVAHLPTVEDSSCVRPGDELPMLEDLVVQIVRN